MLPVSNDALADELIERLNRIIKDPDVRRAISLLIELRVPCTSVNTPCVVVEVPGHEYPMLGLLGVLNGVAGVAGPRPITAECEDDGSIIRFYRNTET